MKVKPMRTAKSFTPHFFSDLKMMKLSFGLQGENNFLGFAISPEKVYGLFSPYFLPVSFNRDMII